MTQPIETEADIRAACEEAGVAYAVYRLALSSPVSTAFKQAILALARRIAAEREAGVVAENTRLRETLREVDAHLYEHGYGETGFMRRTIRAAIEENQRGQG